MFDFLEAAAQDAIYGKQFECNSKKLIAVFSLHRKNPDDGSTLVLACETEANFPAPLVLAWFPKPAPLKQKEEK